MASLHLSKATRLLGVFAVGMATSSFAQQVQTPTALAQADTQSSASQSGSEPDYAHAKPMPLPDPGVRPPPPGSEGAQAPGSVAGTPGTAPGNTGSGQQAPVQLVPEQNPKPGS